ncbi:MAG: RIP metalloprotease RseP [Kordiimonadaceae bacterium]|nr:RIP metalloprotease RseP [Kordiimonadaceae bacterium]MBO6570328.1 RIP metalloprotease RseP [Kordiimonadaceae bacterium]MBO6965574.1 RIP metalloprotease RseP [Kordiimonadaceae bacterium]
METEGPGLLFTIAAFVGGFSILVFIHEWGHYIVARIFGVKIDTFSIGMGKELFGRTDKNGTRWKFSVLPIGGYVKFFGDASAASNPGDIPEGLSPEERDVCFHYKPVWQRALIAFAGPAINLIAAALVFAGFVFINGIAIAEPKVASVLEESAAEKAGLQQDDTILFVNGEAVSRFSDIGAIVRLYPAATIPIVVDRDGETLTLTPTLDIRYMQDRFGNQYPLGRLGIGGYQATYHELGLFGSLAEGGRQTIAMGDMMFTTLGQIVLGIRSVKELGGPVRIANMVGEAASISLASFIFFLAILSLNLGIVNLLPIPVLDGGHLMFYGLEALKGSPLSKKAQEASFVAGMALMLIFMVFVTLNDLQSMAL